VTDRPGEAEAEVAYMLEQEGLPEDAARRVAAELGAHPKVLLNSMVEKELGIAVEEGRNAFQGALIMGASFGLATLVPMSAYVVLEPVAAVPVSIAVTAAVLFLIGVVKSRWTQRNPVRSGLEVVALAAFAGVAGYFFGSLLPQVLGAGAPPA